MQQPQQQHLLQAFPPYRHVHGTHVDQMDQDNQQVGNLVGEGNLVGAGNLQEDTQMGDSLVKAGSLVGVGTLDEEDMPHVVGGKPQVGTHGQH